MKKKCDLHIHSIFSDGASTPKEIIYMAKRAGIDVISITDHNNIDGVELGLKEAKKNNLGFVPGVELSTRFKGERVHLLGYFNNKSYKSEKLREVLRCVKNKCAYKITDVLGGDINIKKGRKRLTVGEGIKILKMFNATVVLAHPVKIKRKYLKEVIEHDFDGLEGVRAENSKEDDEFFKALCKEKHYILTGGSDFHSVYNKSHAMIGEIYIKTNNIYKLLKLE